MRFFRRPIVTVAAIAALAASAAFSAVIAAPPVPQPGPYEKLFTGLLKVGAMDTNGVNCAVLRGSPFMCIKNQAAAPITDIQIVNMGGMMGNGWMNMGYFGGAIQPGGTTIVKFGTYGSGCQKILFVRLQNGSTHPFNLDVCANSSLVVQGW